MTQLTALEIEKMGAAQLKDFAKRGIFRVMSNISKPVGKLSYKDLPQYKKHARWAGVEISQSDAARLFRIPQGTISQWASRDVVTILRRTAREVYLDKADVAYAATIKAERPGAGRWLFNPDRTPFVPATVRKDRP